MKLIPWVILILGVVVISVVLIFPPYSVTVIDYGPSGSPPMEYTQYGRTFFAGKKNQVSFHDEVTWELDRPGWVRNIVLAAIFSFAVVAPVMRSASGSKKQSGAGPP